VRISGLGWAHVVQDLSHWAQFLIVAAAAVLGPIVAILLALILATLLRWIGPAGAAPPPILVGIDLATTFLRKRFEPEGRLRRESIRAANANPARPAAN
jgi:hypothetical protein